MVSTTASAASVPTTTSAATMSHPSASLSSGSTTTTLPTPARNAGTSSIEDAVAFMRKGGFVIVMDNEDRENEGDLIGCAEFATEESIAFMLRHTTGIICVPALWDRLQELQLPLMVENNTEVHKCKFTITVDLREGNSTGVSSADRARTIRALADPAIGPKAFNRPGHIFPLLAQNGGVLVRAGHTEAAVDLARLAGARPLGYICEMNDANGRMMRRPQLEEFAKEHSLPLITISDLIRYRIRTERLVMRRETSTTSVQTPLGTFAFAEYVSLLQQQQSDDASTAQSSYEVLTSGTVRGQRGVAVYFVEEGFASSIHAQWAQKQIVEQFDGGVLIYVNDSKKLLEISGELMARQSIFGMGMQIVRDLGVESIVLLTTDSEAKLAFDPHGFGMTVDRVASLQLSA